MQNTTAQTERPGNVLSAAWVLLPVVVVVYLVLREIPGVVPFAAARAVFLVPIALAALAAEAAYSLGPHGVERRAWAMLALTLAVVLLSQCYYTWYQLAVSMDGPSSPSVFDLLNSLAALMIIAGVAHIAGVAQLSLAEKARLSFDLVAFCAVTFIGLYRFAIRPVSPDFPWYQSADWAAYSVLGTLVILASAWLVASSHAGPERNTTSLAGIALGIFGAGMVLWPVWKAATSQVSVTLDAVVGAVYLIGCYMLMLAALTRIRWSDAPWRVTSVHGVRTQSVWVSTLLSLYVLIGVGYVGWSLYHGQPAAEATAYLSSAMIATLALVSSTGVTALETVLARTEVGIDPVTGAIGGASFRHRCEDALAHAERVGHPLSLVVFDIDAFSRVNAALGHTGGDRVLADVAAAVSTLAAERGELCRLSADEFALICPGPESNAMVIAAELLAVIRGLSPLGGESLSASVGVAGCASGECGREELVRRAKAAEAWAKYHGKGRVVRFDERIVRALGVEERLRAHENSTGLNMVRAIALAADARDPRNYYHSRNVAALSVLFAETLGIETERVRRIEVAALLHDCGKLALPDTLLADVLRTSRQQMAAREHAEMGETLLQSVGMPGVPEWVRHHHERWDGAGYPDGLSGEQVPLESRIIALADAYDAMTSGARNHSPMSRGAALQEIDLGMGSRFDPMLAEHFIEVVGETASLGWSDEWAMS